MTYTAEQLREWADNYEKTPGAGNAILTQLRAHADALEENARLNKWADGMTDAALKERKTAEEYQRELREENARLKSKLIDYAADISNYQDRELSFDAWKQRAERAEAELAETRRDLQFIERWANHHGQKPNITPREVLSMIQHYPPILEITRSYEDGKVPDTPNPWAELAKLRQKLMRYEHAEAADILHPPQDEQARADFPEEK